MLADLALNVIEISITTSVFIGILLLMVPLLQKRYRVQCRYVIWIVIAVRLLLPFKFILPIHPVEINLSERFTVITDPYIEDTIPQQIVNTQPETDLLTKEVPTTAETLGLALSPFEIIGFVWFTGVCVFLLIQISAYHNFLRKLRLSLKESIPEFMKKSICKIGVDMGVDKLPEPVITDAVGTPMLIGIMHPRILLPHARYSLEEINLILRHEMSHFIRKDMWYKFILLLAKAIHWFNPLIHFMSVQAARDIELVCDYHVTQKLNYDERIQYANTILLTLQRKRKMNPMFSTQFGSSKQDMKKRLHSILDMSIKRRGNIMIFLIILYMLFCTGMVSYGKTSPVTTAADDSVALKDQFNIKGGKRGF